MGSEPGMAAGRAGQPAEPATPARPSYGIDAPAFPLLAGGFIVVELALAVSSGSPSPLLAAAFIAFCLGWHLHTTLRGKFRAWGEVLDGLQLRGDERVLDLGCGRGAVLIDAARRLPAGRAVGVDIWSRQDQSGNAADATRVNVQAAGVAERIGLLTADMTALPFAPDSFDLVTASLAIHNIHRRGGRERAIDEAVRVLRPGGRLVVADMRGTRTYLDRLAALGQERIARRSLGWRMWWGGPWGATRLVTATKPGAR